MLQNVHFSFVYLFKFYENRLIWVASLQNLPMFYAINKGKDQPRSYQDSIISACIIRGQISIYTLSKSKS